MTFADDAVVRANNEIGVELGAREQDYREFFNYKGIPGSQLNSETGVQPTLRAFLVRQAPVLGIQNFYTSFSVSFSTGHSNYKGFMISQSSSDGVGDTARFNKLSSAVDVSARVGYGFRPRGEKWQITPFFEYSLHRWYRDNIETYTHHTVGGGALVQYVFRPGLIFGGEVGLAAVLSPRVHTLRGVTLTPSGHWQEYMNLKADYAVSQRLHLTGTMGVRHFHYGCSGSVEGTYADLQGYWFEPSSTTIERIFLVGAAYSF